MLFMGEEWGARTPFQFFTDHEDPELAEAVRNGRRAEFAAHGWDAGDVPDPQDVATVEASTLDWSETGKEPHAGVLDWHGRLIALRRARPELSDPRVDRVRVSFDDSSRWLVVRRGDLAVVCNLAGHRQPVPVPGTPVAVLLSSEHGFVFSDGVVELGGESVAIVELSVRPATGVDHGRGAPAG